MAFLERFLGSDQALSQPDFLSAPTVDISFSGTNLRFKDPVHTALFPIYDWPVSMDIFDKGIYKEAENGREVKRFYDKGWNLMGRMKRKCGGVLISGALERYVGGDGTHSYFDRQCFETYVFAYIHAVWGRQNKADEAGSLGNGPFVYPVTGSELTYVEFNGVVWCRVGVYISGKVPVGTYFTPITSEHIISFRTRFDMYKGLDFFSPETNIKEACYQVVDDFMSNFYIELSGVSKKQQEAVEEGLNA